jgi:hypothetical protein
MKFITIKRTYLAFKNYFLGLRENLHNDVRICEYRSWQNENALSNGFRLLEKYHVNII